MIEIIARIYMGANLFFAGYYLADRYKWQDTTTEKVSCILLCLGTIFFGCAYIVISLILAIILGMLEKIDGVLQLSFWLSYYLTKKWDNLEEHQLKTINRVTINIKNKNTIKDKIYRYCTMLINKRNNYIHNEPPEPQF